MIGRLLRLLPRPAHRAALRIAHPLRKTWWRWRRPDLNGVSVVALNAAGEVLLVRHSYQYLGDWCLPGGGIGRGEDAVAAARRELREEVGLQAGEARRAGGESYLLHGALNCVTIVELAVSGRPRPDGREIIEARFFAPDALPPNTREWARNYLGSWRRSRSEQ